MPCAGVKAAFAAGRLLVRTIDHNCKPGGLPQTGSTTLVWPKRRIALYGKSSRRLCVLYDLADCSIKACYEEDAHTTYTADHASHVPAAGLSVVRRGLINASEHAVIMYNEVVLRRAGRVLGFGIIVPFDGENLESGAKRTALQLRNVYRGATIVTFDESCGAVV